MKVLSAFALAFLLIGGTARLRAANAFELNFDESGDGSYLDAGTPSQNGYTGTSGTAKFSNPLDTLGGTGTDVLIYDLPELVNNGPVAVYEFGGASVSDVLWFTNAADFAAGTVSDPGQNANLMVFYSGDAGGGDLADSGLPTTINVGTLADIATEDINGNFQWLPDGPMFPGGNEYNGESPESPEPASLSMLLIGVGTLGLGAWRRRARG